MKPFVILWAVYAVIWLAVVITLAYVAFHFIGKFW